MKRLLLLIVLSINVSVAFGQCRSFVKNNCGAAMEGFIPGESFNAVRLFPGDEAEVEMTFFSGVDYRLLVCSRDFLGDVNFQLVDKNDEVVYDNAEREFSEYFDFRLEGTRSLILKINVPEATEANTIKQQGCVAILLGRKLSE